MDVRRAARPAERQEHTPNLLTRSTLALAYSFATEISIALPVEARYEIADVIRQNDAVVAHVPVVAEDAHRHMVGHLWQLS